MMETNTRRDTAVRPDAEKVARAIELSHDDPASLILRLAWSEGLTRKEIHELTWRDVDFEKGVLRLFDREVPIEEDTGKALERWKERCGRSGSFVAWSPKTKNRLSEAYLSMCVRHALDAVGQGGVNIKDLRHDFIIRQAEEHGLPYALRISGITLTTFNNSFSKRLKESGISLTARTDDEKVVQAAESMTAPEREYLLWRVLQKEKGTPGGIALWLTKQLGLSVEEIAGLTWADVDFDAGVLRTPGKTFALTQGAAGVLRHELGRRRPGDDPHVVLSPKSRKAVAADRLSVVIRETLIRGGLDDTTAVDVRRGQARDLDWQAVREWVETNGSIMPKDAAKLLGVTASAAWGRLQAMEQRGRLVHIGHKYYSAEKTPPYERLREAIVRFISEKGSIGCAEAELLTGVPSRQIGYILRGMARSGELETPKRGRYTLPAAGGKPAGQDVTK